MHDVVCLKPYTEGVDGSASGDMKKKGSSGKGNKQDKKHDSNKDKKPDPSSTKGSTKGKVMGKPKDGKLTPVSPKVNAKAEDTGTPQGTNRAGRQPGTAPEVDVDAASAAEAASILGTEVQTMHEHKPCKG